MRRIVVGLDGSRGSRGALTWACEEAAVTGAEIVRVLAYSSGVAWIDVGSEFQEPMMREARRQAERRLAEVLAGSVASRVASRVDPVVTEGSPADVLVEAARDADLLVVGSRGRGRLHRSLARVREPALRRARALPRRCRSDAR